MKRPILNFNNAAIQTIAAMSLFLIAGCRHADTNRELVEREMRLQEDELYRLHDEIAAREKLLKSAKEENGVLKRELEQARSGTAVPPGIAPAMPPAPTGTPPRYTPRPDSGVPSEDLVPPTIEVPGLDKPPSQPPAGRSSWNSSRRIRRASFEEPVAESGDSQGREAHDGRVAKIVLNRRLTGGYNADQRLGDEGVMVVIEPRGADDRIIKRAGDVSIAVIDPAFSGAEARVARWDLKASEIERLFRTTPIGDGVHLQLRWPARPPQHERLMLFVRFTTADGERHEANQPVLVDLGGDSHAGNEFSQDAAPPSAAD